VASCRPQGMVASRDRETVGTCVLCVLCVRVRDKVPKPGAFFLARPVARLRPGSGRLRSARHGVERSGAIARLADYGVDTNNATSLMVGLSERRHRNADGPQIWGEAPKEAGERTSVFGPTPLPLRGL
jgi:hypothetical protein